MKRKCQKLLATIKLRQRGVAAIYYDLEDDHDGKTILIKAFLMYFILLMK